jgi:hypothetical protein
MSTCDYDYQYQDDFDREYYDSLREDDDPLKEYVTDCGDPRCCMNFAPHYRHECYTPEMYEAFIAEVERLP